MEGLSDKSSVCLDLLQLLQLFRLSTFDTSSLRMNSPRISPISSRKSSTAGANGVPISLPIPLVVQSDPSGRTTSTDMNNLHRRRSSLSANPMNRSKRAKSRPQKTVLPLGLKWYHFLHLSIPVTIVTLGVLYSYSTGSNLYNAEQSLIRSPSNSYSTSSRHHHQVPIKSTFYFANKKNPFNVYGVKLAWFWTSLFSLLLTLVLRRAAGNPRFRNTKSLKGKEKLQDEEQEEGEDDEDDQDGSQDDQVDDESQSGSTIPDRDQSSRRNQISPVALSAIRWILATLLWGKCRD